MNTPLCPKCGSPVDEGRVRSISASAGGLVYRSNRQQQSTSNTAIQAARGCLSCGYVELYLKLEELEELKSKLA